MVFRMTGRTNLANLVRFTDLFVVILVLVDCYLRHLTPCSTVFGRKRLTLILNNAR